MMRSATRWFLVLLGLVLVAAGALGQGLAVRQTYTLTINVNVPGAQIFVDSRLINGISVPVVQGRHSIRVHLNGFFDYTQTVDVAGNTVIPVTLRPIAVGFPLAIRPNVPGATVSIDGVDVTGQPPVSVSAGQHTVLVQAPGYRDYTAVVTVSAAMTVPVALVPAGFALTVNANVPGATVFINSSPQGPAPYTATLAPGAYNVQVSAPGYTDFMASVNLSQDTTVVANLVARNSTIGVVIVAGAMDPDTRAADTLGQVRVFIDNRFVNPNHVLDGIPISPGHHRVRVSVGGLTFDLGDVVIAAGQRYQVQVSLAAQLVAPQQ